MKEKTRNIWTGIVIMIGLILAGLSGWICFSGSFVELVQWIALGVGTLLVGESIFIILSLNPEWKGKDVSDSWKFLKAQFYEGSNPDIKFSLQEMEQIKSCL